MSSNHNKNVKLLFSCLDWRLHPQIENYFIKSQMGCDLCVTAGSVKGLLDLSTREFFLEQISISKKLHNCQAVILTMHLDCGAYGGASAFAGDEAEVEHHKKLLIDAQAVVNQKFSDLAIEKYIIGLAQSNGEWVIKPIQI